MQLAQTTYHDHWQARWAALFAKAGQIQGTLNQLEMTAASPAEIAGRREALCLAMAEIQSGYKPDLMPRWLLICSNLGMLFGIIELWMSARSRAPV